MQNVDFIVEQNAKELGSPASYREIVFTSTAFGGNDPEDTLVNRLSFMQVVGRLPAMEQKAVMLYAAGYSQAEVACACESYQRAISRQFQKLRAAA